QVADTGRATEQPFVLAFQTVLADPTSRLVVGELLAEFRIADLCHVTDDVGDVLALRIIALRVLVHDYGGELRTALRQARYGCGRRIGEHGHRQVPRSRPPLRRHGNVCIAEAEDGPQS